VTVPGFGDYDIVSESISYNSNPTKFQSQPWWGNQTDATTFGNAWLNTAGRSGFLLLAYNYDVSTTNVLIATCNATANLCSFDEVEPTPTYVFSFATPVATPVPGPLPLLGAAAAFGYSRRLRRRVRLSTITPPADPLS
jgi:hypothetical protein